MGTPRDLCGFGCCATCHSLIALEFLCVFVSLFCSLTISVLQEEAVADKESSVAVAN